MDIEAKVFQRKRPDFSRFEANGFVKTENGYHYETPFMDGDFQAILDVDETGRTVGSVIDKINEEEYVLLRISSQNGTFVNEVRTAYENILANIAKNCYIDVPFESDQANRIGEQIYHKYGARPDFPWAEKTYQTSGVFRHADTGKWYGLIMYVRKNVFDKVSEEVWVNALNLKINPDDREMLFAEEGIYQAYHMNHKMWISIILDDTVNDERVMELVAESYRLTGKRSKQI